MFELRASQAWRWMHCTAYRLMAKGGYVPDIEDTTVRDEGLAFHWAALMVWLGHRVDVGQRVQCDGMSASVEVDDAMIDAIDEYLDRIKSRGGMPMLEYTVAASRIHASCGGTTDAWNWVAPLRTLYVDDAKYGYRWVDPFRNPQCLIYVSGLLDHIGVVDDREVTVVISIFQPRAYRRGGPWFEWRVNAAQLRAYFNELSNAADEAMSPNAKCRTGEWCNSCGARPTCDAFNEAKENALDVSRAPVDNDLTPERVDVELQRVERALDILDAHKMAMQARAEMFIRSGKQLRNYEMQPGRSALRWKDGMEPALEAMERTQAITLFKRRPITPTQAKKLLPEPTVDALSDRMPGKLKLVRVDGDRAARLFGTTDES